MLQLKVPFYSNTPDGTHCFQAALRSVLKYYLSDKEFTWEELEKLTLKKEGLWTWTMAGLLNLRKIGFEVINMEDFDYRRLAEEGEGYLVERYGLKIGKIQAKNSDMVQERSVAKEFSESFGEQKTLPSIEDIKGFLEKGYLVICNINLHTLNKRKGYTGHFVVVIGFDDGNLYLHDPGLPPQENRKVKNELFLKAWGYPNDSLKNLVAFRYSK